MTEVIEKTIAVLPKLIAGKLLASSSAGSGTFHHFVKTLGRISSQYEEDAFIKSTISQLKDRLSSPNCPLGEKREILVTLLYCDMLGYNVTFAHIHALKLAHQGTLREKRTGYLACTMFLRENDDLVIMLTGTMMKDLQSSNVLHVCYALDAAACLISADLMPTMLPPIQQRLTHPKELVRRKAVMCVQSLVQRASATSSPSTVAALAHDLQPAMERALCDPQPSVMAAALHVFMHLARSVEPAPYRASLVPALVGLVGQVLGRHLPPEYEHHGVPAPWLTVHALKLLTLLGAGHEQSCEQIFPVLRDVLQRTEITHKAGLAVIYECVESIGALPSPPALLEHAAACVARFLTAKSINYKYLGLKALTSIVKVSAQYAVPHQDVLIDCLDHEDADIRQKTLDLLYYMANASNMAVISGRLMDSLRACGDPVAKTEIAKKILTLAQKFTDRHETYLDTVNQVLGLVGDVPLDGWTDTIIRTIQKGSDTLPTSEDGHLLAVRKYWTLLQQDHLPPSILNIAVWVLGEYSHLTTLPDLPEICRCLVDWYAKSSSSSSSPSSSPTARLTILAAFIKLLLTAGDTASDVIARLVKVTHADDNAQVTKKLEELECLSTASSQQKELFRACLHDDQKPDFTLSFLDDYVSADLEKGGQPYRKPTPPTPATVGESIFAGIAEAGIGAETQSLYHQRTPSTGSRASSVGSSTTPIARDMSMSLQVDGVKKVWGREGNLRKKSPEPAPPIAKMPDMRGDAALLEDETTLRKSQLATSLFAGISLASPTPKPPSHLPQSASLHQNLTTGTENRSGALYSRSEGNVANMDERSEKPGVALSSSCAADEMPPMLFSIEPDHRQNQTKPEPRTTASSSNRLDTDITRKSNLYANDPNSSPKSNLYASNDPNLSNSKSNLFGTPVNPNSSPKSNNLYTDASPDNLALDLDPTSAVEDPASQNLLTASALTSPVEFEGSVGSMYAMPPPDLSPQLTSELRSDLASERSSDLSPDDYVNVQELRRDAALGAGVEAGTVEGVEVGAEAGAGDGATAEGALMERVRASESSYHSSPCKSIGSIDTDSIEEP